MTKSRRNKSIEEIFEEQVDVWEKLIIDEKMEAIPRNFIIKALYDVYQGVAPICYWGTSGTLYLARSYYLAEKRLNESLSDDIVREAYETANGLR